jgi:hypothetical protein
MHEGAIRVDMMGVRRELQSREPGHDRDRPLGIVVSFYRSYV